MRGHADALAKSQVLVELPRGLCMLTRHQRDIARHPQQPGFQLRRQRRVLHQHRHALRQLLARVMHLAPARIHPRQAELHVGLQRRRQQAAFVLQRLLRALHLGQRRRVGHVAVEVEHAVESALFDGRANLGHAALCAQAADGRFSLLARFLGTAIGQQHVGLAQLHAHDARRLRTFGLACHCDGLAVQRHGRVKAVGEGKTLRARPAHFGTWATGHGRVFVEQGLGSGQGDIALFHAAL